jgi:general stress protein 26
MTTNIHDLAAVQDRLWQDIRRRGGTGMLGLTRSGQHFQPMTAVVGRETGQIWFFTRKDTELVQDLGAGSCAMFLFQTDDLQASIGGDVTRVFDHGQMNRHWNPMVAASYPEGKADPALTMLHMDCIDAEVWISNAGPTRFAWEVANANTTHQPPDLGGRAHIEFH